MANLEDCNNYSKGISILDQFLLVEDRISGNDQQRSFKGKKKNNNSIVHKGEGKLLVKKQFLILITYVK